MESELGMIVPYLTTDGAVVDRQLSPSGGKHTSLVTAGIILYIPQVLI